ncbi:MAG: tyrosine-type recombinase/integrase [Solirubrobacteraceae bacterium]
MSALRTCDDAAGAVPPAAPRVDTLTLAEAARIMREAVKDKSYQLLPLGQEAAAYLRVKRKRLTESSHRDYERGLDKLARYFPDLELADFEPPRGIDLVEEFLDSQYGDGSPRNYNKNLSILRDFFRFQIMRSRLHGDPTLPIERARPRDVHRTTFTDGQRRSIVASSDQLRDRIALRLLLDYAMRKGALKAVQFKHFDYARRRLTIFTKGAKVRELPIPHALFWTDLERHLIEAEAQPNHYLMCRVKTVPRAGVVRFPDKPMGDHGMHDWWYHRLEAAGIVPKGTTSGERMHKARHTAGQRVLDKTNGNLKAVQKLLGHSSIQTTGDIYTDWDDEQLAATMADVIGSDEYEAGS